LGDDGSASSCQQVQILEPMAFFLSRGDRTTRRLALGAWNVSHELAIDVDCGAPRKQPTVSASEACSRTRGHRRHHSPDQSLDPSVVSDKVVHRHANFFPWTKVPRLRGARSQNKTVPADEDTWGIACRSCSIRRAGKPLLCSIRRRAHGCSSRTAQWFQLYDCPVASNLS
jgi:hypothetical protein